MKKLSWTFSLIAVTLFVVACGGGGGNGGGAKVCVGKCQIDSDCGTGLKCLTSNGQCVECLQDSDCGAPQTCNTTSHSCTRCTSDADCVVGNIKIMTGQCDTFGRCLKCASSSDCHFAGSTIQVCGPSNYCVACAQNSDCPGTGHQCIDNSCIWAESCTSDQQCQDPFTSCKQGICSCSEDAACQAAFGTANNLHWSCVNF